MILSSFSIILVKHCQLGDYSIRHQRFTIKGPSSTCVYLAPLRRYGASNIGRTDVDTERKTEEGKEKKEREEKKRKKGSEKKKKGKGKEKRNKR